MGADAVLGAAAAVGGVVGGAASALMAANAVMDRVTMGLASGGTQKFHVEKGTVLQAGKVIEQQWQALSKVYDDTIDKLRIKSVDGVVTSEIVNAWNDRLVYHDDSYANRIKEYMKVLQGLSDQLRESAQQYGFTEEEIQATFRPKS